MSILFWVLSAVCMGVIFYFSSRTSTESSMQSDSILLWITKIFGENAVTDFIVRKTAHCLEYTGLCLLLNCAWLFTKGKPQRLLSILCASLYAVTDEVHQLFVDGRSCEFRDWGIDTFGAILGTLAFTVLAAIISAIVKKCKKSIDKSIQ